MVNRLTGYVVLAGFVSFLATPLGCSRASETPESPPIIEPPGRNYPSGTFDTKRGVFVLFGGVGEHRLNDTWEWDGDRWVNKAVDGPSARAASALAFNATWNLSILFGGGSAIGPEGDTWTWDGSDWIQLGITGPSARACHSMAFDVRRSRIVLYGGSSGPGQARLTDTWEFDGNQWTKVAEIGPPGNCFHAMTYHEGLKRVISFGGRGADKSLWAWDGKTWTRLPGMGPGSRDHHALTYDRANDQLVLFGGMGHYPDGRWNGTTFGDTWAWKHGDWTTLDLQGPPPRGGAPAMVYDPESNELLLFGGILLQGTRPEDRISRLWVRDVEGWHLALSGQN